MTIPDPTRTEPPPVDEPPVPPSGRTTSDGPADPGPGRETARPIAYGVVLIAVGVLWLLTLAGVSIPWEIVLPVAMIAIGILLVVGGRLAARSGFIGLGVVVAVLALAVTVTPTAVPLSAGERTETITDVAELDTDHRLGAGSLTLDLRDLELPAGTTEVTARVSMGELIIHVPPEVMVEGEGRAAMGEVVAFDTARGGIAPDLAFTEPGDGSDRTLVLDLRVGLGSIEVDR